jgi:hypothetical protein
MKTPWPYYIDHAFVAIIIQLTIFLMSGNSFAGTASGIAFYAGREVRDREKLGSWDYAGLIAPVLGCSVVHALLFIFS